MVKSHPCSLSSLIGRLLCPPSSLRCLFVVPQVAMGFYGLHPGPRDLLPRPFYILSTWLCPDFPSKPYSGPTNPWGSLSCSQAASDDLSLLRFFPSALSRSAPGAASTAIHSTSSTRSLFFDISCLSAFSTESVTAPQHHRLMITVLSELSERFLLLRLLCSCDFRQSALSEQRSLREMPWNKFRGKLKLGVSKAKAFSVKEKWWCELQDPGELPTESQPALCILDARTCPSNQFSPSCLVCVGNLTCWYPRLADLLFHQQAVQMWMFISLHRHPPALNLPIFRKEGLTSTHKLVALIILIA